MRGRFLISTMVLVATCSLVKADDTAATQPATTQAAATQPDATPRAMLLDFDAKAGGGPEVFLPFFNATNDDEKRVAATQAKLEAQMGMLQVMVEKKWGKDGMVLVLHAFGDETTDDIANADYQQDGDDAAHVTWKDGSSPLKLVRVEGKWKVDVSDMLKTSQATPAQYIISSAKVMQVVADVADDIVNDHFKDAAEAVEEATKRLQAAESKDDAAT